MDVGSKFLWDNVWASAYAFFLSLLFSSLYLVSFSSLLSEDESHDNIIHKDIKGGFFIDIIHKDSKVRFSVVVLTCKVLTN